MNSKPHSSLASVARGSYGHFVSQGLGQRHSSVSRATPALSRIVSGGQSVSQPGVNAMRYHASWDIEPVGKLDTIQRQNDSERQPNLCPCDRRYPAAPWRCRRRRMKEHLGQSSPGITLAASGESAFNRGQQEIGDAFLGQPAIHCLR